MLNSLTDTAFLPMSQNNILQIRETIALARLQEHESHELETYLSGLSDHLHKAIDLPKAEPAKALLQFVLLYIEHVPDFLQALSEAMKEANIYSYGKVFIEIASDFFVKPPEVLESRKGLNALIDQAYLAHRLIEEVNDRLLFLCNTPLTPMDMTLSNIVIHDILGEQYANQLDLAVHYAIEALFDPENLKDDSDLAKFIKNHHGDGFEAAQSKWTCLAGDSCISLNLDSSGAHAIH